MTTSTEAAWLAGRPERGERAFGAAWRAATARAQEAVLPRGRTVLTCSAARGVGGLGRHLQEIAAALERAEQPTLCICGADRDEDSGPAHRGPRHRLGVPYLRNLLGALPVPVSPGLRTRAFMVEFDNYAAGRLPPAEHLLAFNGQALGQLAVARGERYETLGLVSANSHIRRVAAQHARAQRQYPLEGSWAARLIERNLAEYTQAETIYLASRYARESFLQEGFAEERLADFPLTPDPRYRREPTQSSSGRFEIVYVGSLAVHKGVPLLIDAVRRLPHADLKLTLVGGWATRGMRRFVQSACAADPRISAGPGDPLPHLRGARLCVHPAYEDGFAYAPAEALACGVPVIVTEDTGMKDLIDSPDRGLVVPTGELGALTDAIDAAYRGEILVG